MNYETFEEWFEVFIAKCRLLGYHGVIDRETFEIEYESGKDPHEEAEVFVKEMNE